MEKKKPSYTFFLVRKVSCDQCREPINDDSVSAYTFTNNGILVHCNSCAAKGIKSGLYTIDSIFKR